MRVGVFGGSFDPVHVGHLIVAEAAADVLRLVRVLFVPARVQPLKAGCGNARPEDRVAMLRSALRENPRFILDTREIERDGPSYTVDTLRELRSRQPEDELFLLLGADAAWDLPRWHEVDSLPALASIVVLSRPGVEIPESEIVSQAVAVPAVGVSATYVREIAHRGDSLRYLVPSAVREYIETHGLYGSSRQC